jgi:hypothetical protein
LLLATTQLLGIKIQERSGPKVLSCIVLRGCPLGSLFPPHICPYSGTESRGRTEHPASKEKRNQGQLQAVEDSPQGTKLNSVVILTFLVFFLSIFTNILFSVVLQKLFRGRGLGPRGALGATIIIQKVLEKLCNVLHMCIFSLKYTY